MSIDYERYIIEALQKSVLALNLSIPVKYIGRVMTIPSDNKWLELIHIPNNPTSSYWSDEKIYRGIFRMLLHWPMDNRGIYPPLDYIRNLAANFQKGSKFADSGNNVTVMLYDNPNVQDIIEEPPELVIPLTIRYTCFKV